MGKCRQGLLACLSVLLFSLQVAAQSDQWRQDWPVPAGGRANPYQFDISTQLEYIRNGKLHTQIYPVSVTGLLPPLRPIENFFENPNPNPLKELLNRLFQTATRIRSLNTVLRMIGMNEYPKPEDRGVYSVPYPNDQRPDYLIGFGAIERNGAEGFSISCAVCHTSNLFGKTVLGMTNRFPRANHTLIKATQFVRYAHPGFFQRYNKATEKEMELFESVRNNAKSIGGKEPLQIGLDTSLAQVALSLAKRKADPWATKDRNLEKKPRPDNLETFPADSKPAVWWNLKYKNRWLSDGSVISGNPVFTNILWNEIGRGTDLKELDQWLQQNTKIVEELTTAVFSSEAPRITDFFDASRISLERAQAGEKIFENRCAKCHGHYDKAWSQPGSESLSKSDLLKTVLVRYHEQTPVKNVGTDPNRYMGMKNLEVLNTLEISKNQGTVIQAQRGYVPPPLVGIWARWPYFHNNSIPNLCALLTRAEDRPVTYYSGEAKSTSEDFDFECNGYPLGAKTPANWKVKAHLYDTRREGMQNLGHDDRIFLDKGQEILSPDDKRNLIQFLQTL